MKLDKYDKYLNNKYLKIVIPILVIIIFVVALIGAFTFLKPQDPSELFNDTQKKKSDIPFEKRPGISNVKTFTDAYKNKRNASLDKGNISDNVSEVSPGPTRTPKPLPYPRIEINFTSEFVTSIGDESAGDGYKFLIVKMDIRNYGYKYFDAHPTKFGIASGNTLVNPIVNVSTENTIDAVIPNNSRAKGDIIFLLKYHQTFSVKRMKYKLDNYKIIFNGVSSIEDEIVEDEVGDEEKSAEECNDYDYEEGKCYD